jgi:hypothetical protein
MDRWLTLLVWVLVFGGLIGLLGLYARGVVDLGLTGRFRAAEAISNGRTPAQWVAAIDRQLALWRALLPWLRSPSGSALAARRAEQLSGFFERSTFFEDEAARALLLARLAAARERWSNMTWEQIRAEA